jgi:proline iminopeptidase
MDEGALALNAARLAGIPRILIRGAFDFGPPLDLFWRLARGWPESELVVIDEEGHRGGGATGAALIHATDRFAGNT